MPHPFYNMYPFRLPDRDVVNAIEHLSDLDVVNLIKLYALLKDGKRLIGALKTQKCSKCDSVLYGRIRRCSGCNVTGYCSTECQKGDWKVHKMFCRINGITLLFFESMPTSKL